MLCTTLVLSRQSMQLVRNTPCWTDTTAPLPSTITYLNGWYTILLTYVCNCVISSAAKTLPSQSNVVVSNIWSAYHTQHTYTSQPYIENFTISISHIPNKWRKIKFLDKSSYVVDTLIACIVEHTSWPSNEREGILCWIHGYHVRIWIMISGKPQLWADLRKGSTSCRGRILQ